PSSRVRDTPPAAISSSASARSPGRVTSCRHYGRDNKKNKNRCSCQFSRATASPHPIADAKRAPAVWHHHAALQSQPKEVFVKSREPFARPAGRAREIHSTNHARIVVDPANRGNAPLVAARKDREHNHQARRRRVADH